MIVQPKPTLSSSKTPPGICSGYELSYTATTATQLGQIIGWKREAVSGISNARAEESGAVITETLINTTSSPVEITYIFLLEADGCTNQEEVKVLVTTQNVITVKNATENEGDDLVFEVTLSGAACAGGNPTVDFTTFDGPAVAPDAYTAVSGTLIFTPGETTKTAISKTNADNIIDGRETMRLRLSSPAYCQLSGGNLTLDATGTIEDRTDGTIIVEKYKPDGDIQAAEPSTDGSFLIRFKNTNVTCTDEVKVEFSLSGADPGIDYVI